MYLIGFLRFIVYIGRFDICLEVSMISYHMTLPREEHLDQVLHLFLSLREYYSTEMVFDTNDHVVDESEHELKYCTSSGFFISKAKRNCLPTYQNAVDWYVC